MTETFKEKEVEQANEVKSFSRKLWFQSEASEVGRGLWNACKMVFILLLICGVVFPLAVYAIGQAVFPFQANGSLLVNAQHQITGSRLIGQSFTRAEYFHGRPSVTGYNASSSSGSNLGPTNPQLITGNWSEFTLKDGEPLPANATPVPGKPHTYIVPGTYAGVKTYAEQFRKENHLAPDLRLPADIVTASGSGLDPNISIEAALLQIQRILQARHVLGGRNANLTEAELRALVNQHTSGPDLGFIGESRVNVLELNLDLDRLYGTPPVHS